jgi:hypothetical protein
VSTGEQRTVCESVRILEEDHPVLAESEWVAQRYSAGAGRPTKALMALKPLTPDIAPLYVFVLVGISFS